jgi:hypothetical protein
LTLNRFACLKISWDCGELESDGMNTVDRVKFLRVALVAVGLIFLLGVYPLTIMWPAGWAWHHAIP